MKRDPSIAREASRLLEEMSRHPGAHLRDRGASIREGVTRYLEVLKEQYYPQPPHPGWQQPHYQGGYTHHQMTPVMGHSFPQMVPLVHPQPYPQAYAGYSGPHPTYMPPPVVHNMLPAQHAVAMARMGMPRHPQVHAQMMGWNRPSFLERHAGKLAIAGGALAAGTAIGVAATHARHGDVIWKKKEGQLGDQQKHGILDRVSAAMNQWRVSREAKKKYYTARDEKAKKEAAAQPAS